MKPRLKNIILCVLVFHKSVCQDSRPYGSFHFESLNKNDSAVPNVYYGSYNVNGNVQTSPVRNVDVEKIRNFPANTDYKGDIRIGGILQGGSESRFAVDNSDYFGNRIPVSTNTEKPLERQVQLPEVNYNQRVNAWNSLGTRTAGIGPWNRPESAYGDLPPQDPPAYNRDIGRVNDWDIRQERVNERERNWDQSRNVISNNQPIRPNINNPLYGPGYYNPYGPNSPFGPNQRPKLPACGVWEEWRPDLMGMCRPEYMQTVQGRDVFVTTPYGKVRGFSVTLYDGPGVHPGNRPGDLHTGKPHKDISVFLGIPYAQPPTEEGRFRPPRAAKAWSLWDATDFGPACPQPIQYVGTSKGIRSMNEDCLYLNIFTPTTSSVSELFPVMFYIHDGDFLHGASNTFPGHMLSAHGQVIVVTVNYRLGALGFLSTADEQSPGNYGMLDLSLALKWVYDNIYVFQGNKERITLFGPGAGAIASGMLAVAPKTRNMVRQVIGQDGSPLADYALIIDRVRVQNTTKIFAEKMGCDPYDSYARIITCLKSRSFEELGNVRITPDVGMWAWAPIVDTEILRFPGDTWYHGWEEKDWKFLSETPEYLIKYNYLNPDLHYMVGMNRDAAAHLIFNNKTLLPDFRVDQEWFDMKLREFVHRYNYTLNPDGIYQAVRYMYTYWPDPSNTTKVREQYIDFMSDVLYRSPADNMLKMVLEKNVPSYMYVFNMTIKPLRLPVWAHAVHGIEDYYLAGAPFMDPEFFPESLRIERNQWTDEDRMMSEFMLTAYSNFARFGNPTPAAIQRIKWLPARIGDLRYLAINTSYTESVEMWTNNSTMQSNYRQTELAFWSVYMPTLVGYPMSTYRPFFEYWWEPRSPVQIAFWSATGASLVLLVLTVATCCLWRGAARKYKKLVMEQEYMMESYPNITENMNSEESDFNYKKNKMNGSKLSEKESSTMV
ncbi:neuroligin-4, Y-linked-like [Artemia franciscana]